MIIQEIVLLILLHNQFDSICMAERFKHFDLIRSSLTENLWNSIHTFHSYLASYLASKVVWMMK